MLNFRERKDFPFFSLGHFNKPKSAIRLLCAHCPAYQDEYFTMPFHHLFCDCFDYSFEDLCNINDFRVNVEVRLVTKEQD